MIGFEAMLVWIGMAETAQAETTNVDRRSARLQQPAGARVKGMLLKSYI